MENPEIYLSEMIVVVPEALKYDYQKVVRGLLSKDIKVTFNAKNQIEFAILLGINTQAASEEEFLEKVSEGIQAIYAVLLEASLDTSKAG